MRAILLPFDFSPHAKRALRLVLQGIPFGPEVEVEVLHVIDSALYDRVLPGDHKPSAQAMQAHIDDAILATRTQAQALDFPIRVAVVEGDPFSEMVKRAALCGGVIVGGQGHGGLRERFLGRTANRLAEQLNVPLLVVKSLDPPQAFGSIVCGVDFSQSSKEVIRSARDLARVAAADLITAHVVEPLPPALTQFDRRLQRENVALAREKLAAEERLALGQMASVEQLCFVGSSVRKLTDIASLYDASFVVVGRHSRPSVAHAILGSVASRVLQHSQADVLVVPLN